MQNEDGFPKLLLRIGEACSATGYSRSFLYERISAGELPVVRSGRTVRIRRDQLEAWIERQQQANGAE